MLSQFFKKEQYVFDSELTLKYVSLVGFYFKSLWDLKAAVAHIKTTRHKIYYICLKQSQYY